MRVLISTFGSRGDVQPMAGLAVALRTLGAEAIVAAPPDPANEELLARLGVPFAPTFMSVQQWMSQMRERKAGIPELAAEIMGAYFNGLAAVAEDCDAVVAGGLFPSTAAAQSVADKRGISFFYGTFCPLWLPSSHHKPFAFPGYPQPEGETDNSVLWQLDARAMEGIFGAALNANRQSIGLQPVENIRDRVFTHSPLLAADPLLAPWEPTALCHAVQTGAWTIEDDRELPSDLRAFLSAGEPPVYVGFGSMSQDTLANTARETIAAARAMGCRVIVSAGWANLVTADDEGCFLTGEVNQQKLFKKVSVAIHHGGAGTTTTALLAGVPQIVVPQMADQPYFAGRVETLGIGAALQGGSPTQATMTSALNMALAPAVRDRARLAAGQAVKNGAEIAAKLVLEQIPRR